MNTSPILLSLLVLGLTLPSAAARPLFDSNEDGIDVIASNGLTARSAPNPPEPDGNETIQVGGDPENDYSKFYNPSVGGPGMTLLAITPDDHEKKWILSYEVYLPTDSQVEGVTAQLQFFRDNPPNYKLDFSNGDDENKVKQTFYSTAKVDHPDQWQTLSVSGEIPAVDEGGEMVEAIRFYLEFKQRDAASNQTPLKAFVRNIQLSIVDTDSESAE